MIRLWEQGESFSGKRPLGNSGWQSQIIESLIEAGLITTEKEAETIITKALLTLG